MKNEQPPTPSETSPKEPKAADREGWELRFIVDPARAREAAELYQALGFEVRTERVAPDQMTEVCEGCTLAQIFVAVYVRRRDSSSSAPEAHRKHSQ